MPFNCTHIIKSNGKHGKGQNIIAIGLALDKKRKFPYKHRCILQLRQTEHDYKEDRRFIHKIITSQTVPINNVYNSKR